MAAVRKFAKEWAPVDGRKDLKTFRWVPKTERMFTSTAPAMPTKAFGKGSGNANRRMGATITHRQSNAWQGTRRSSRGMGLPADNDPAREVTPPLGGGGAGPLAEPGAAAEGALPEMTGQTHAQLVQEQAGGGGGGGGQDSPLNTVAQQPQAQHAADSSGAAVKSGDTEPQASAAPVAAEAGPAQDAVVSPVALGGAEDGDEDGGGKRQKFE
jgi:hypothetical protein